VAVSDTSILASIRTLAAVGGILAEPAGAAGFAGLQGALTQGLIRSKESVVILVTGTGLKTPQYHESSETAFRIRATLDAVANVLEVHNGS
jgi:threonine synthase